MKEPVKPSGHCNLGHDQRIHGFVDSEGYWRCRVCRKEKNLDREFWKLVKSLMADTNVEESMDKLKKYHWRTP